MGWRDNSIANLKALVCLTIQISGYFLLKHLLQPKGILADLGIMAGITLPLYFLAYFIEKKKRDSFINVVPGRTALDIVKNAKECEEEIELTFRGQKFKVKRRYYHNEEFDINFTTDEQDEDVMWALFRAYWDRKGFVKFSDIDNYTEEQYEGKNRHNL